MHESGLIRDLMTRVEAEIHGDGARVLTLRFRVGAMAGIDPETLRQCVSHYAEETWGHLPEVRVERSDDPSDSGALGVRLVSIGIGD